MSNKYVSVASCYASAPAGVSFAAAFFSHAFAKNAVAQRGSAIAKALFAIANILILNVVRFMREASRASTLIELEENSSKYFGKKGPNFHFS